MPQDLHCRALAAILVLLMGISQAPAQACPSQDAAQKPSAGESRRACAAFEKGKQAEADGDWASAFASYTEAAQSAPGQAEYAAARERARFRHVQSLVDRAERSTAAGRFDQAVTELRAALALDPGYSVAQERLRQLEGRAARSRVLPVLAEQDAQLEGPAGMRTFNFRGNTRGAYEEVARQFGITVDFDRDLRVQPVRLKLENVDFPTVMSLLTQMTGAYWRPVDRKAIYVVENTAAKRREFAPTIVRTILLSGSTTPEEMTEIQRVVREITNVSRTTLDTRSRTLTLRDEPERVNLAIELIRELEQARGELMLEINILEVDRSDALRLGILPPSSAKIFTISPLDLTALQNPQTSPQALAELLQRIFGTAGTGFGLGGLVPPLVAFGGGRTVLLATLPGASADFAQTYSVLRRARRMLLRSSDGEAATFFLGERFPINFSVLSQGIGQGTLPGTQIPVPGQLEFAVGDAPAAMVSLDFSADGVFDLAVANRSDDTVSILLGSRDGAFSAATSFPAGDGPSAIAAGDFDADGFPDLAVTDENSGEVSILLSNGDGTFQPPSAFPVGAAPRAIRALSLDLGGTLDLVVANSADNDVSVLLGNGDGTFAAATNFPTGLQPVALAAANLNNDTFADMVVANHNSDSVSILLGDGSGGFGPTTDFATGAGPAGVVISLLDADTVPDIATANQTGNSVSILLGNGDGTFGSTTDFAAGGEPTAIVAADVDGLGDQDLAVANRADDSVSVFLGNGDGTLGLRADFAAGSGPVALITGDFNFDGRVDLAVANEDSDNVSLILNSVSAGLPSSLQPQPYPAFQYEDIGLKVSATPRLHLENEVTLQLRFEIRSLSGDALNGIPVISNRTLEQTVRLRENQTTLLAGMIQDEERRGMQGWPGIGRAPVLGLVTSTRDNDDRRTELLIMITPRRIRLAPRQDRQLYAGRDPVGTSRGAIQEPSEQPAEPETPAPEPQPQPQPQPPAPGQQPPPQPFPRPPVPQPPPNPRPPQRQ